MGKARHSEYIFLREETFIFWCFGKNRKKEWKQALRSWGVGLTGKLKAGKFVANLLDVFFLFLV